MKLAKLATLILVGMATAAVAQEPAPAVRQGPLQELHVAPRVTMIGGDAFDGEDWGSFFGSGVGLEVGASYLVRVEQDVHLGVYTKLSVDAFDGDEESVFDDVSLQTVTVETDSMRVWSLVLGLRARESFGAVYLEQFLGAGLSYVEGVDADLTVGATTAAASAIKGSVCPRFEIGVAAGVRLSPGVGLKLSIAFEAVAAPEEGSDVGGLDLEGQENIVVGLGLDLAF